MDAASKGALCPMDGEKAPYFGQDSVKWPSFVATVGLDDIAVHRIARPDDGMAFPLHGPDERGQAAFDLVVPEARNQRHPPWLTPRIKRVEHFQKRIWSERGAAFHTDRIADTAQKLDMGRSLKTRPVANPQEMRAGIIPVASQAVLPGQALLIRQQQRFVAGVKGCGFELRHSVRIDPARFHEGQRLADTVGHFLEFFCPRAACHEIVGPAMYLLEIGVAASRESAKQIERRG